MYLQAGSLIPQNPSVLVSSSRWIVHVFAFATLRHYLVQSSLAPVY